MKPLVRRVMTDEYRSQEYRKEAELYPELNDEMEEVMEGFWKYLVSNISNERSHIYLAKNPIGRVIILFEEDYLLLQLTGSKKPGTATTLKEFFYWYVTEYNKNFLRPHLQYEKLYRLFLLYIYTINTCLDYYHSIYEYKYELEHNPDSFPELDELPKILAIKNILDFRWACVGWTLKESE